MAYAMIAGMPPIYGLYAAFIPQVVYALFGSSRQLSVAPSAMVSLLVYSGISTLASPGSDYFVSLAITLALMVGILQLFFGLARMGFLVNFLPNPVITGYTAAAAIIIGLSQLRHLLGVDMPSSNLLYEIIKNTMAHTGEIQWFTVSLGLIAILLMVVIKKINRALPGPIIIVIIGILSVYLLKLDDLGFQVLGAIPQGLPTLAFPNITFELVRKLFPLALIISLVGFMESISVAKAMQAKRRNYFISANRELTALGLSNIIGSFFNAFTVSGGLARSAVNEQAGANTNLSSVFSAILMGITLAFLTPLFYFLPKVILAAIIMVAVSSLINLREAGFLWRTSKKDFLMGLVTFVATLLLGVQIGITAGVVISLILVIHRSAYPHSARLGKLPDTNYFRNLDRFPEANDRKDALIFRFDAQLYFANIDFFKSQLHKMSAPKGSELKVIVVNAQSINALDASAVHGLEDLLEELHDKGIEFYMTEVIGPVRDMLKKTGLLDKIGVDHFHMRVEDALNHFDQIGSKSHHYATQTNV